MFLWFQSMMAICIQQISLFLLIGTQCCSAANIIVFTYPVFSHIIGPANVAKVLQDQNHNVMIAIPSQMEDKFKGKGVKMLIYDSLRDLNVSSEMDRIALGLFFKGNSIARDMLNLFKEVSDKILRDQQLLEEIRSHKPDLIILDPSVPARMLTVIAYKLDIPFMFMGPFINPQFSRIPLLPSVVPSRSFFDYTDQMTFPQRLCNTLVEYMWYIYDPCGFPDVHIYAPEKPHISMQVLQAKAHLWLVTEDGVLDYNAPTMPNVKQISHLLPVTPNPLPPKFQFFMDNAKDGVVVVSFGSILKSMPRVMMDKLLRAFKRTKYNYVIRHSMSNYSDSDKVFVSNWIPQYDLLCHENTRLFVTHCGSNGQQESVLAGVPMIGFPIVADQPYNAARVVRKGFGLRLDLMNFSVEEVVAAIEEIITNPEYKRRTQKAATIMRSQIVPPLEEAAFWINHILTFGAEHLRSLGQDLPLWQYLGLDVLLFCLLVCCIIGFISLKMLSFCIFWCFKSKEKIKKQ